MNFTSKNSSPYFDRGYWHIYATTKMILCPLERMRKLTGKYPPYAAIAFLLILSITARKSINMETLSNSSLMLP